MFNKQKLVEVRAALQSSKFATKSLFCCNEIWDLLKILTQSLFAKRTFMLIDFCRLPSAGRGLAWNSTEVCSAQKTAREFN